MSSFNNRLQTPIVGHRRGKQVLFKGQGRVYAGRRWRIAIERRGASSEAIIVKKKPVKYKDMRPPLGAYKPMQVF